MTAPFSRKLGLRVAPLSSPSWTYVTYPTGGGVAGERVPLGGVGYSKTIAGTGSLQGAFTYSERRATALQEATMPVSRSLVAFRNGQAQWGGIIIGRQHDASTSAVKLTCADWWWYFGRRRVTRDFRATLDQNLMVGAILAGVSQLGDIAAAVALEVLATPLGGDPRIRQYDRWSLAKVSDVLGDYAGIDGGSDIAVDTTGDLDTVHRQVLVGSPQLGRPVEVSQLRWGKQNLPDASLDEDGSGVATDWWCAGAGEEAAMLLSHAARDRQGLPPLEDYTSYKSVEQRPTLDAHARADLAGASGLRLSLDGSTRQVVPSDLQLGDEAAATLFSQWYPGGKREVVSRVTSFKVKVPDTAADEQITPTFGEWVA